MRGKKRRKNKELILTKRTAKKWRAEVDRLFGEKNWFKSLGRTECEIPYYGCTPREAFLEECSYMR